MDNNIPATTNAWVFDETTLPGTLNPTNNKFQKPRQRSSDVSKERVEQAGKASLSVLVSEQPIPQIKVDNVDPTSTSEFPENSGPIMRVNSARSSQKFDSTAPDQGQPDDLNPPLEFQKQLTELVNDLTNKVLINQPENIYGYLADYLEDKVRTEKRKAKKKRRIHRRLSRSNSNSKYTHDVDGHPNAPDTAEDSTSLFGTSPDAAHDDMPTPHELLDTLPTKTLSGSKDVVTQSVFFRSYIAISSLDSKIRIFDLKTGKQKLELPNHKPINCFSLVPVDEKRMLILIGSSDGQVPGWRVKFGNKITAKFTVIIPMHQPNPIRVMSMSPKGKYLATGCCFEMKQISLWGEIGTTVRGTLKLWDMDSVINYVDHPQHYYDDIEHLALKTQKQIIARAGKSNKKHMASYQRLSGSRDDDVFYGISSIAFTPDDSMILVGFAHPNKSKVKDTKMLAVLKADTLETLWLQYAHFYQICSISTAGKEEEGKLKFVVATEFHLNVCTLEIKHAMPKHDEHIDDSESSKVRIKFPWRIDFDSGEHHMGTFSPDGALMASACGARLFVMRAYDGQTVACYDAHISDIKHVAFSEDGNHIATSAADNTVKIWKAPRAVRGRYVSMLSEEHQRNISSPRRRDLSGDGNPIHLSPHLYDVNVLTPEDGDPHENDIPRRLSRRESRDLNPGAYAFRSRSPSPISSNPFERTLSHLHKTKENTLSPRHIRHRQLGETVTS